MRNTLLFSGLLLLVVGCSSQLGVTPRGGLPATPAPVDCGLRLAHSPKAATSALDADGFSLVNWNIQKGGDPDWIDDLRSAHPNPDLVILQEAVPDNPAWAGLASEHFHSFAQGFTFGTLVSGVMTTSTAQPLTECRLVAIEPWLGTRKATLITEYALTASEETLLVVNIHGVNFALGLRALQEQLREAQAIIAQHTGPVLFSGDFNTWHDQRAALLQQVADTLGLVALDYNVDHRKRVFGQVLDHIFVRGLEPVHTSTLDIRSSDHNPMTAVLRLKNGPGVQRGR